jgi:hypothetical protein
VPGTTPGQDGTADGAELEEGAGHLIQLGAAAARPRKGTIEMMVFMTIMKVIETKELLD